MLTPLHLWTAPHRFVSAFNILIVEGGQPTFRLPFGTSNITKRGGFPMSCVRGGVFGVRKGASNGVRLEVAEVLRMFRHGGLSQRCFRASAFCPGSTTLDVETKRGGGGEGSRPRVYYGLAVTPPLPCPLVYSSN